MTKCNSGCKHICKGRDLCVSVLGGKCQNLRMPHKTKIQDHYFGDEFIFCNNFLIFAYFQKQCSLLICIFALFRKDTHEDYIYDHIKTGHNSHYGHLLKLAVMSSIEMAINMVFIGVFFKIICKMCGIRAKCAQRTTGLAFKYKLKMQIHRTQGHTGSNEKWRTVPLIGDSEKGQEETDPDDQDKKFH